MKKQSKFFLQALAARIAQSKAALAKGRALFITSLFMSAGVAHAGFDIGMADNGMFDKIVSFWQAIVDVVDGPIALGITVVSLIAGVFMWALAPKSGAMGMILRVAAASIVALNIPVWVAAFQNGG